MRQNVEGGFLSKVIKKEGREKQRQRPNLVGRENMSHFTRHKNRQPKQLKAASPANSCDSQRRYMIHNVAYLPLCRRRLNATAEHA